jgi:hypothetical protein
MADESYDPMMGVGAYVQPQPKADPALKDQWTRVLSDPTTMAALFNAGIALMQPRWNPESALPEALSAGARTFAGEEQLQYNRATEEEKRREARAEREAERQNRLATARIGADSRAEVANIRTQAMLEGINIRNQLRAGPGTGEEQRFYDKIYSDTYRQKQQERNAIIKSNSDKAILRQPPDPVPTEEEIRSIANERAYQALIQRRLNLSTGGAGPIAPTPQYSPNPPQKTSPNPVPAPPPVGPPGSAPPPKKTSENPQTRTAPSSQLPSWTELYFRPGMTPQKFLKLLEDDEAYNVLRQGVRDPELFDQYRRRLIK